MTKSRGHNFSRRQVVSSVAATAGVVGLAQLARADTTGDQESSAVLDTLSGRSGNGVPYIPLTGDGPLYPPGGIDWRSDLTTNNGKERAEGQMLYLFGRILDSQGSPLNDASVEIWQTDFNGNYRHPRGWNQDDLDPNFGYFGKVKTSANGLYVFKTIRPRWYSDNGFLRAAHIHLKMRHLDHGVLTTQTYFENSSHDEVAPKDSVFSGMRQSTRDRIVLPEETPNDYKDMNIDFEQDAICCKFDLAFLL